MARQGAFFGTADLQRTAQNAPEKASARHIRERDNLEALGGMRRPDRCIARNHGYAEVGRALREALLPIVKRARGDRGLMQALRRAKLDKAAAARAAEGLSADLVAAARAAWFSVLGRPGEDTEHGPSPAAIQAWGEACNDLDAAVFLPNWLREGAPQGILEPIPAAGVFPPAMDAEPPRAPDTLHTEQAGWTNHQSADAEPDAVLEILREQES